MSIETVYAMPFDAPPIYDNGGAVFNAKHRRFAGGAKGDGTTDDTAAIQAAIDAAVNAGGGTVLLPPPTSKYRVTQELEIGDAGNPVSGVLLAGGRFAKGTGITTLFWDGATGGGSSILSIRNAFGGHAVGIGFDAANKADYCVQVRHVSGDTNAVEQWLWQSCTFERARTYNFLSGEEDGIASTGDAMLCMWMNCYFKRDLAGAAQTTAHVRIRSNNTFAQNFHGCGFDHGANYPAYAVSMDSGNANFYGIVSVGTDTTDLHLETATGLEPPNVCVYGWESQNTNFMRADLTGGGSMARMSVLSGVKHNAIAGTPGDAIQWNQPSGGWGGLVLEGCRFTEDVNIQSSDAKVWAQGVVFDDLNNAGFTTNPQVVDGSWYDVNGWHRQVVDGEVLIAQKNSINQFESKEITIANDGVIPLGTNTMIGFLVVADNEGGCANYLLRGSNNATVEVNDPMGIYSVTAGTAVSVNIYWSAGNSRYELENKRGGSRNFRISFFGFGG